MGNKAGMTQSESSDDEYVQMIVIMCRKFEQDEFVPSYVHRYKSPDVQKLKDAIPKYVWALSPRVTLLLLAELIDLLQLNASFTPKEMFNNIFFWLALAERCRDIKSDAPSLPAEIYKYVERNFAGDHPWLLKDEDDRSSGDDDEKHSSEEEDVDDLCSSQLLSLNDMNALSIVLKNVRTNIEGIEKSNASFYSPSKRRPESSPKSDFVRIESTANLTKSEETILPDLS
jgi:hypothetical protein